MCIRDRLATAADIVADPSAPDAFVQGIMEGKEWIWDNGLLREREVQDAYNRIEQSVLRGQLEEQTLREFYNLLNG